MFAGRLPTGPGVYMMRDAEERALYVGKARNLRKRVASYFDTRPKVDRIMRMLAQVESMEVSLTRTEGEALLLENEWIKSLKPRYNILLRDDKSYPRIVVTDRHQFPRITFHRGAKDSGNRYFGPYPSAGSVRESLSLIQKLFRIRNCEDSYFEHRKRPCLQYQIRRCTAPCVGFVTAEEYAEQVSDAVLFLEGRDQKILTRLIRRMEEAAERQEYEAAAMYRDQINALKQMQAHQFVSGGGDVDFVAVAQDRGKSCVQVVSVRGGRNLGQRSHFPSQAEHREAGEVLNAFVGQYYQNRLPPAHIVLSHAIEDRDLLADALSAAAGRKVQIQPHPRGARRQMVELAQKNAAQALGLRLASEANVQRQLESLRDELGLDEVPASIECFDISHTAGSQAMGSCVAFDASGPVKSCYRRYKLRDITPGDDYAAMKQVLTRRYGRLQAEEGELPDLVLIDGGKGQLKQAIEVLADLGLNDVALVGVAKGPSRRPGYEEWVRPPPQAPLYPGPASPASHLVQRIRDEAHRFAITGHRASRTKASTHSGLEDIPGVGPKRRRQLLSHFGGLQGVRKAGVEELASVPGINRHLAEQIFRTLH
ncbi:excinuclease ABC subunit UvrC [Wenzhouxiangellaceae bacterium CH-27]|uniref:UvrABC system protein C n=1 Tax=Elongatibacter sediminis TaxID=3119006 RepID=A0AAW9RH12_9GAMM